MPIQSGDVKLLKSAVMADVPEGGGAPTGIAVADGVSNAIFPDISELERAGGRVSLRKLVAAVATDDQDLYFGSNLIVAEPPKDPLVAVTFFSSAQTFETRAQATSRVEQYLNRGPMLPGYLLENHVAGQRTIQLLHRPGVPAPNIGRTIVLVLAEETAQEQVQYVRVIAAEVQTRTFTEAGGGGEPVDFLADVVTLEISDALRHNWPGSPATRFFMPATGKTRVRDTIVADAGSYYGVAPLSAPAALGDVAVKATSVYSQLVPNARTETPALDQRPAAQRLLQLATSPRLIEVANTPHTMRIRVGQENRGFSWVQMLKPFPAPGTVIVSYMALGEWYTLQDDGAGGITGQGVGTVNYANGSISITLPVLPDTNTSIIFSWGEKTAYTNRAGQAGYRAPEFAWALPQAPVKPGSVVVTWISGNVLKTATDNGTGGFTGDASGEINYPAGQIFLRPTAMIDAGGEFNTAYTFSTQMTENFPGITPDAGGFALINLLEQPAPNSLTVRWVTVRNVTASSGSSEAVSKTESFTAPATTTVDKATSSWEITVNDQSASSPFIVAADPLVFKLQKINAPAINIAWRLMDFAYKNNGGVVADQAGLAALFTDAATSGTFSTAITGSSTSGTFTVQIATALVGLVERFTIQFKDSVTDSAIAACTIGSLSGTFLSGGNSGLPPADTERTADGVVAVPGMRKGGHHFNADGTAVAVYVVCEPLRDQIFGWVYNPPKQGIWQAWTDEDMAAGQKTLKSMAGIDVVYKIWK